MIMGRLHDITLAYGEQTILDQVSVDIPQGACIAIVGANGAGKTTLLSLLAGTILPTSGEISWSGKAPSISYFKQEQAVENAAYWQRAEAHIYRKKWKVSKETNFEVASGGEKMKMRLSAAFSENRQLILLDEPTNHLDQDSLEGLIEMIRTEKKTYMIVSHDRYFIDQIADYVFEIEYGKLTVYQGNYTAYQHEKAVNREIHAKQYIQQQRKIAQVEEQIEALGEWSDKAHAESRKKGGNIMGGKEYFRMKAKKKDIQIRSKRKRLEAELDVNRIEKPEEEVDVSFTLQGQKKKGRRVVECKDVTKSFGTRILFSNVSFTIQAGERVACIGPNGAGKSTLFRMILGEEQYEGNLWVTEGMSIGYLSQNLLDMPDDVTIANYFQTTTFEEQGRIRIQLKNLGFSKKHWHLPVSALSMGERVKLKLMQFILEGTDVLLLDEPTNHLDLPSREALEKTLETFPGTLIFASHDRYFTERMSNRLLIFEDETIQKRPMTYQEWTERASNTTKDQTEADILRLETELQAVLGKLSMLKKGDPNYDRLDQEFFDLSKRLRELRK